MPSVSMSTTFQSSPTAEGGRDLGSMAPRWRPRRSFNPRPPLRVGATAQ